jgi:hypothetical protein
MIPVSIKKKKIEKFSVIAKRSFLKTINYQLIFCGKDNNRHRTRVPIISAPTILTES